MSADGYFPPGSLLRRVHQERVVGLLYGQRALGIGALAPLNFIGTQRHTRGRDRPFQRLSATGKMFETIFFGSREEADRVLATVHRLHEDVKGALPEDAGPFPAGTPYSAYDPELMLWTVAVTADSAQFFYELFLGRLSDEERDSLWSDYVRFGELFGMPRDAAPGSYADFRAWWERRLGSPGLHLTDEARQVGAVIMFEIPVPVTRWPAMRLHNVIMLGSLPPLVRRLYGLHWTYAHAAAFRGAVAATKAALPVAPRGLRTGRNTSHFELVAETERRLRARGVATPGALPV